MPSPDIYDLDAVIAEREPVQPFAFRFGGEEYTLPPRPDMRAAAAFSAERIDEGFRLLLGPAQWERMQASDAVFDDQAFLALQVAYMEHLGEDLGIGSLCALLEQHGEAVEADLQQFYGIRLADLGHTLTWRRLGVLLRQLPPNARTVRVFAPSLAWNTETHLLALIADLLAAANWQRAGGKGPRPRPIERPGGDTPTTKQMGTAVPIDDARRMLDDWNRGGD